MNLVINPECTLRDMKKEDLPFVSSSWLKSFAYGRFNKRQTEGKDIFRCHDPVIRSLLVTSPIRKVMCASSDEDLIQAWIVAGTRPDGIPLVHYCYVRENYRGLDLEERLFIAAVGNAKKVVVSHLCVALDGHIGSAEVFYDPYSVITTYPKEEEHG